MVNISSFLVLLLHFACCHAKISSFYSAHLDLRGHVTLRWGFDDEKIEFIVSAPTSGWIGLGFSESGSMSGADIAFMWVKDGSQYLLDMHATYNTLPELDQSQDFVLLSAVEKTGRTTFHFERNLQTCDENDATMKERTFRVIYAFGDKDPDGQRPTLKDYHKTKRGVKSIKLINPIPVQSKDSVDESALSFEVRPVDLRLPRKATYYYCKVFKMPQLQAKHHIIEIEPIITPGNEKLVHHITIHQCSLPGEDYFSQIGGECYSQIQPHKLGCTSSPFGYAIGGSSVIYPKNVGYPIDEKDSVQYLLLETHYDNPNLLELTDGSGIRLYYTSKVREIDAGTMILGFTPSMLLAIPPRAGNYIVQGHCLQECLSHALEASQKKEITIIGGILHAHLAGKKLSVKHFRNGKELKPVLKDEWYDVNHQSMQYLDNVKVRKGDNLVMQCDYSTKERRNITFGGLTIYDEMCQAMVSYYPKIDLPLCMSRQSTPSFFKQFRETTAAGVRNRAASMKWSNSFIKKFNADALKSPINPICNKRSGYYLPVTDEISVPKIVATYQDPSTCSVEPIFRRDKTVRLLLFVVTLLLIL